MSTTTEFHHVHFYVNRLKSVDEYHSDEERLTALASVKDEKLSYVNRRAAWVASGDALDPAKFAAAGQDIVAQMIHGLGWRITAMNESCGTRTLQLQSEDTKGVKFLVSAKLPVDGNPPAKRAKEDVYDHFRSEHIDHFYKEHADRQGCGVLAFKVGKGDVAAIEKRYRDKHPSLLSSTPVHEYDGFKILEVYAYYKGDVGTSGADTGTVLRFVEGSSGENTIFPGLTPVKATFDGTSCAAYFDHWVSNVVSRTGFLSTLEDTLDFSIKVDFNAGVVAAGQAQIESTVTGNNSVFETNDSTKSLVDQSQVYLPTNNALTEVGHVHWYLEQLGQGIQHLASRVGDLTTFIARVNTYREITGHGFTFLNIPLSYYGRFVAVNLTQGVDNGVGLVEPISETLANTVVQNLVGAGLVDETGIVKQETTDADASVVLKSVAGLTADQVASIARVVVKAQYSNLFKLLRDNLCEEEYLGVVRNKILVDVQDGDILYQIFTCTVMQNKSEDEAPFLEFIQRVCGKKNTAKGEPKPIVAGCGGFGIRNFLTLFLSIEVSKAMSDLKAAKALSNVKGVKLATDKIEIFTSQLDKANPILTAISDAMTAEGVAKRDLLKATTEEARTAINKTLDAARATKLEYNKKLQENSSMHSQWMDRVCNA